MNIGDTIYSLMQGVSVTGFDPTKCFPNVVAQGESFPAVVYEIDSKSPERSKSGNSKIDTIAFSLYIFSNNYDLCNDISEAVRGVFDGYRQDEVDKIRYIDGHTAFETTSKVHVFIDTYEIRLKR